MPERIQTVLAEHRAKRRVLLLAEVSCHSRRSFSFGKTENISETGLMINSPETLPLGSEVEVRLVVPVYPQTIAVETRAKVVWVRPGAAVGIQFLDLKEEYRRAIAAFVQDSPDS